tara:strand:+ start:265 stop:438 length:174 start_codon:yes stop_codon:yes gene_type:complete
MLDRYATLYSELKILEYQLKQKARQARGRDAGFRIKAGRRGFVKPEVFNEIMKGEKK